MKNPEKSLKKDWNAYVNSVNSNLLSKIQQLSMEKEQMQGIIQNKETSILALIERTIELQNIIAYQSRTNKALIKKNILLKEELQKLENLMIS